MKENKPIEEGTMSTAKAAAAELYKEAIDAAIEGIEQENIDATSRIGIALSDDLKEEIVLALAEGLAVFDIQVHLPKNVKKDATLRLLRGGLELTIEGREPIYEPFFIRLQIKAYNKNPGNSFVLKCPDGSSYTCDIKGDVNERDKLVVMAKAFRAKTILLYVPKTARTKPLEGCRKLNIRAGVCHKRKVGGIRGLIRDEAGDWCTGFWGQVDTMIEGKKKSKSRIMLMLEALSEGLSLAIRGKGKHKIIIESHESLLKRLLEGENDVGDEPLRAVVDICKGLLKQLGNYEFADTDSRGNMATYNLLLAGYALPYKQVKKPPHPPDFLEQILLRESKPPSYQLPL